MKKEYKIKEKVWIHLGDRKLTEGRVVDIIDLEHLGEGHSPEDELYVIELKTGIDDVYEVRTYSQISDTAEGPINFYKQIREEMHYAKNFLKKIGFAMPDGSINPMYFPETEETKKPKKRYYRKRKTNNE